VEELGAAAGNYAEMASALTAHRAIQIYGINNY
jgi:hypothetical protein